MAELLDDVRRFTDAGGPLLWTLVGAGTWLWAAMVLRLFALTRGSDMPADAVLSSSTSPGGVLGRAWEIARLDANTAELRRALDKLRASLRRFRRTIRMLSATAPMMGLLGTVVGMINTFEALGSSDEITGVAAGISEALITTELGLAIAIPGTLLGAWLDRREKRLTRDIDIIGGALLEGRT